MKCALGVDGTPSLAEPSHICEGAFFAEAAEATDTEFFWPEDDQVLKKVKLVITAR